MKDLKPRDVVKVGFTTVEVVRVETHRVLVQEPARMPRWVPITSVRKEA